MSAPTPTPDATTTVSGLPVAPTLTATSTATVTTTETTPAPSGTAVDTSPAIIIAAIIAVSGVALTGLITWLIGKKSVGVARRSADAATDSAKAANISAEAATKSSDAATKNAEAATTSAKASTESAAAATKSAAAAQKNAEAAERSSKAAERSSQIAESSVQLARTKAIIDIIPSLSSTDNRQVEAALVLISQIGDPDLARQISLIYQSEGGIGALQRLSATSHDWSVKQQINTSLKQIYERFGKSVVRIFVDRDLQGAGFVVRDDIVATCFYNLRRMTAAAPPSTADPIEIGLDDGTILTGSVIRSGDEDYPVGLVKIDAKHDALNLGGTEDVRSGDEVSLLLPNMRRYDRTNASTPAGGTNVSEARVTGRKYDGQLALEGTDFKAGFGGAPVIGHFGSVIGMIFRREGDTKGWALPSEMIQSALDELDSTGSG
jgi:hypothetical protein